MTDMRKTGGIPLKKQIPSEADLQKFIMGSKDAQAESTVVAPPEKKAAAPKEPLRVDDLLPDPREKDKTLPIKIPPKLHKEAAKAARENGMSLHEYILRALAEKVMQEKAGKR